jgi:hypothetical protein
MGLFARAFEVNIGDFNAGIRQYKNTHHSANYDSAVYLTGA